MRIICSSQTSLQAKFLTGHTSLIHFDAMPLSYKQNIKIALELLGKFNNFFLHSLKLPNALEKEVKAVMNRQL